MSEKLPPPSCATCPTRHSAEWRALPDEAIALLDRAKLPHTYARGEMVFAQGDACAGVYCMEQGTVALRRVDRDGNSALVSLVHAGHTLGRRSYFSTTPRQASAEVLETSSICAVPKEVVEQLLNSNAELCREFLKNVALDLGEAHRALLQKDSLPVRNRMALLLLYLYEHYNRMRMKESFRVPLTRQDMAELIGSRPETVTRALHELQEEGLLHTSGRTVNIPDAAALRRAAEQAP